MAVLIDLDTEQLQTAVQTARKANERLTDAANHLNKIMIHNDWVCPTRDTLNANTSRNRAAALTMQNDAETFYNTVVQASQQFLEAEQEIMRMFDSVDAPIAQFLSLTPSAVTTDGAKSVAKDFLQSAGEKLRDGLGSLKESIDVVSFGNIADLFKGD